MMLQEIEPRRGNIGWWRALCVACFALVVAPIAASGSERPGRHFVLLIDDSGDMGRFEKELIEHLSGFLYGEGSSESRSRPVLDPNLDLLSVVFFTIHADGDANACKTERRYSALPEAVFEPMELDGAGTPNRGSFEAQLKNGWQSGAGLPVRGRQSLLRQL
ncbi:MAG: hypothetical protein HC897_03745 [Thermoanaerobaculia bacterium]|nr:hypothetical protein [Thermoanaerobaculia bacterium]